MNMSKPRRTDGSRLNCDGQHKTIEVPGPRQLGPSLTTEFVGQTVGRLGAKWANRPLRPGRIMTPAMVSWTWISLRVRRSPRGGVAVARGSPPEAVGGPAETGLVASGGGDVDVAGEPGTLAGGAGKRSDEILVSAVVVEQLTLDRDRLVGPPGCEMRSRRPPGA